MSNKPVITKEQAEKIEWAKNYFKEDGLSRIVGLWMKNFSIWEPVTGPLIEMKLDDLIRSLYIGYEVEPEFKIGDWIYISSEGTHNSKEMVAKVESKYNESQLCLDNNWNIGAGSQYIRHATPSEIAEEKERRFWNRNDRDVWELRKGDVLICDGYPRVVEKIDNFNEKSVLFKDDDWEYYENVVEEYKVLAFNKDRLDVKTNE